MTEPSGMITGVNGSAVYPIPKVPCSGAAGAAGGASSGASVPRRRRPMVRSRMTLAIAPTPAPYAPSSPEPSKILCSGLYTPLAIRFWAICCAASVAPSTPPRASAVVMMFLSGPILGASKSSRPVGAPSRVAALRSSAVAPACSAPTRDSPAPAAILSTPPPIRPATPAGPSKKNGSVEPRPSPSLRPTESS